MNIHSLFNLIRQEQIHASTICNFVHREMLYSLFFLGWGKRNVFGILQSSNEKGKFYN